MVEGKLFPICTWWRGRYKQSSFPFDSGITADYYIFKYPQQGKLSWASDVGLHLHSNKIKKKITIFKEVHILVSILPESSRSEVQWKRNQFTILDSPSLQSNNLLHDRASHVYRQSQLQAATTLRDAPGSFQTGLRFLICNNPTQWNFASGLKCPFQTTSIMEIRDNTPLPEAMNTIAGRWKIRTDDAFILELLQTALERNTFSTSRASETTLQLIRSKRKLKHEENIMDERNITASKF